MPGQSYCAMAILLKCFVRSFLSHVYEIWVMARNISEDMLTGTVVLGVRWESRA